MKALERFIRGHGMLHATDFGRRSCHIFADPDLIRRAKKEKEQELVREFPIEADIVGNIIVDLLMMNGLLNLDPPIFFITSMI